MSEKITTIEHIETDNKYSKARLLTLVRMLYEKTDEQNKMTTFQILDYLRDNKIHSNDKTLRREDRKSVV